MYGTGLLQRTREEGHQLMQSGQSQPQDKAVELSGKSGKEEIDTRFGKVMIDYDMPILMEKGMLGMADKQRYCLLPFPVASFPQFRLLQSLEDHTLSFITLPVPIENPFIQKADIMEAASDLQVDIAHVSLMLVVNVYRDGSQVRMSVNARAPILMDNSTRQAEQVVLRNAHYQVRHPLSGEWAKPATSAASQQQGQ